MITNFFIPEWNNHDIQELWFQQDGATCHTARATIDLLKDTLGDRLISRFGPVNWPPRSCDLTPLDNFLWGYVKSLVYADKPQTLDYLEDNIRRVSADIRPQMLEKVIENWTSRLNYIRASRGSPMPEIIFKIRSSESHWSVTKCNFQDLEPFLETGSAGRRPGQGRRRATMPNEDRYLVLTARRHRNMNAPLLQKHLLSATGTTVSTQTLRNRLQGVGVFSSGGTVAVGIILRSCTKVSDLTGGVLVYGGISNDGRTDLYIIRDGPLTARRYRDEILRPIVVPYAAAIGDDFILMGDNCRPHRANMVKDFLFEEGIVRMEWPACSPDMNPIEHVWNALGRRVAGRQPPPQTLQEL
ncbi:transposable element Tcb2 transposase [Trichonephila clavipes]|nr:transposable element Tcb2 transposase [Trichonephila clavipes]